MERKKHGVAPLDGLRASCCDDREREPARQGRDVLGQGTHHVRLGGLPRRKGTLEGLLSLSRQGKEPHAPVGRSPFLDEPVADERREVAREGRPVHHEGFGQPRERYLGRVGKADKDAELRRSKTGVRQRFVVALRDRARGLSQSHSEAAGFDVPRRAFQGLHAMVYMHPMTFGKGTGWSRLRRSSDDLTPITPTVSAESATVRSV